MAGTDKVEIITTVDPSLIGGFIVSLGSQVVDASLAGQVRRLGLALAKVS
jgi:F-type H+-transporting ATPase subunit delta